MHNFYEQAENVAKTQYNEEPLLQDDMDAFREDLKVYYNNLMDYRAHLVHKVSEAAHDEDIYNRSRLTATEVVVIWD